MKQRYLAPQVRADLDRKMVFLSGPRQVGKTTLARSLLPTKQGYLNWDIAEHREAILRRQFPPSKLWVFDEIHKYRPWRNWLKGVWDGRTPNQRVLVTGSARLDLYRRGGDSLQGRYHLLRLHPLSVKELGVHSTEELQELLTLGGFPEPFYSGSATQARRWSREYRTRLVRDEVTSLERVQDLGTLELLVLRLPELVGSPLSINALREDLQVAHKTVKTWVEILERLYAIVLVPPFGHPRLRAVKKEQKHYHYDWTLIQNEALRFENLVAMHLLKWVHYQQDVEGRDIELRYFRDVDGREVDFIVTENRKPILAVECKWTTHEVSKALRYFKTRFATCEAWQVTAEGEKDYLTPDGIRCAPALQLLSTLA